jgi:hypothetical protein
MGKHESFKDEPAAASSAEAATVPAPPAGDPEATPKMALSGTEPSKIEAAKADTPKAETSPSDAPKSDAHKSDAHKSDALAVATAAIELVKLEAAKIEATPSDEPKIELWTVPAPHIAPDLDDLEAAAGDAAGAAADDASAAPPPPGRMMPQVSRFTLLAASLALAAGLGGMVGALATSSLVRPGPAPAPSAGRTGLEEFQALKEQVVQARVDLAALKVSIDAGNRGANAQFTRIGERIERIERSQAEPAAKLNKAVDTLDRLARGDAASRDVTGTIAPPVGAAPIVQGAPGAVPGWTVRDVRRGTALIEGRMGIIEVDQGDVIPGLGRVEAIRKQDGRWVVVTSRGLITSPR